MLSEEPTKFAARQNSKYLIYWLTIFNQLTSLNTATIWSCMFNFYFHQNVPHSYLDAPKLPHLLTQLFLENPDPKNENLNFLLNRVLVKIDVETIGPSTDGSTQSIIHLMIKHIG